MTTDMQKEKKELLLALILRPGTDVNIDAKQLNGKPLTTLTSAGANRDVILISLDYPLSPRGASDSRIILIDEARSILNGSTTKDLIVNHMNCFKLMRSAATPEHGERLQNQMLANIKKLHAASENLISKADRDLCFDVCETAVAVCKKASEELNLALATKNGEERQ